MSVFLLACAIENSARQGPSQQIGEMQMGGEKAPRWLSVAPPLPQPPSHPCSSVIAAARQDEVSADKVRPADGWTKPGTGCENGWRPEWEVNTDKQNERRRGITSEGIPATQLPEQFT